MTEGRYDQYKDALRRGHVASVRGRLDLAEAAYRAAATMAPDRALPLSSLADVLLRLGRPAEALAAYDAAVGRMPDDPGALRGRADLQARRGARTEAARDFEALAVILERGGDLDGAADAARRALELAESRSRRALVDRLSASLRGDDAAEGDDIAASIRPLDPAPAGHVAADPEPTPRDAGSRAAEAMIEASTPAVIAATDVPAFPSDGAAPLAPATEAGSVSASDPAAGAGAAPDPAADAGPAPDPEVLRAAADALLEVGDVTDAASRYLELAATYRHAGRHEAAMDACFALLSVAPDDHRLQLEIATIQLDRGWSATAAEKVRLLARLAELESDVAARDAVAAFAASRRIKLPDAAART